jgi:hypothetical protein
MVFGGLLLTGLVYVTQAAPAQTGLSSRSHSENTFAPLCVPVEALTGEARERVRAVVEHPTLATTGPVEIFNCQPTTYRWLVDHPDQGVRLWRCLGAKCTEIVDRGNGCFGWQDGEGSEVHWQTVLRSSRQRVWYAEGSVRPGFLLPTISVQAVVVLEFTEGTDPKGKSAVRHQMSLVLHTDSQAATLATRLIGASAPRMAEQYVGQMEMFFGALAWYLDQHPERGSYLLDKIAHPGATQRGQANPRAPSSGG